MTSPPGHPDWQDITQATGTPLADQPAFSLSSTNPFAASGWISSWPSMRIRVAPSGSSQGCTVTLTYSLDAAGAHPTGSYQWIVAAPAVLAVIVPNLGPFVTLSITTTTGTAFNTAIQLMPLLAACASPRYMAVGNEVHFVNQSVAASATVSALLPFVAEGPGQWTLYPRDATGKLNGLVWEVGQGGGQSVKVDEVDGILPTAPVNRPVYGASQGLGLFVTNTDGTSAHSFDARLIIDGR